MRKTLSKTKDVPYVILEKELLWQPVMVEESDKPYIIYPSSDGTYRIRAVPKEVDGFEPRLPFPQEWGENPNNLHEASGIRGALFCHKGLFTASANTLEAAKQIAQKAYEIKNQ